jgi:hypothetical protein
MGRGRVAAKDAHEHRLAGQELAHQAFHQPALHARLQVDARAHVEHRSRLGVHLFAAAQRNLQRLHDVADNLVFHGVNCNDER